MEQAYNNVADIIVSENSVKVVARKGYSLPGELGKKGIKEFEPYRYEPGYVYNYGDKERVYINTIDSDYYRMHGQHGDPKISACVILANKAYNNALRGGNISYPDYRFRTDEKIVQALMDVSL